MNLLRKILIALCLVIVALGMTAMAFGLYDLVPASARSLIGCVALCVFSVIAWLVSTTLRLSQSNAVLSREMAKLKTEMEEIKRTIRSSEV